MNPLSSSNSPYKKDTSANTPTGHHECLVCSYENNAAKEKNLSQFVIRIVLLTLYKGVVHMIANQIFACFQTQFF